MSNDTDARHLLWRFTEREVAALTVAAIFQSGAVPQDPKILAGMCAAAGVSVLDVRRSVEAVDRGRWTGPSDLPTEPAPQAHQAAPPAPVVPPTGSPSRLPMERPGPPCEKCGQPTFRKGLHGRYPKLCAACKPVPGPPRLREAWNKRPEEPTRTCRLCGITKPIEAFAVRSDMNSRRGECDACRHSTQRARYAKAQRGRLLLELLEGDAAVGVLCAICGKPFAVGHLVKAVAPLFHANCDEPASHA